MVDHRCPQKNKVLDLLSLYGGPPLPPEGRIPQKVHVLLHAAFLCRFNSCVLLSRRVVCAIFFKLFGPCLRGEPPLQTTFWAQKALLGGHGCLETIP